MRLSKHAPALIYQTCCPLSYQRLFICAQLREIGLAHRQQTLTRDDTLIGVRKLQAPHSLPQSRCSGCGSAGHTPRLNRVGAGSVVGYCAVVTEACKHIRAAAALCVYEQLLGGALCHRGDGYARRSDGKYGGNAHGAGGAAAFDGRLGHRTRSACSIAFTTSSSAARSSRACCQAVSAMASRASSCSLCKQKDG